MPGQATLPRFAGNVTLRRLSGADLPAFQAYRNDPEVGRYQGWSPLTDEGAAAFLAEMSTAPLWRPGAWTQIGIAASRDQRLGGDIGLFLSSDARQAEIGFTVCRADPGSGMASAAVREAIGLVFSHTAVDEILGITDARNAASIRLLQRVGMRKVIARNTTFRAEACVELVYRVTRAEAQRTPAWGHAPSRAAVPDSQ
ncbi:MAG: GNAT family N-acetyltransferase [Casimicrobiaceae bacterium]